MASRLTRWSVGTLVALAALVAFSLPPKQQFLTVYYDFRTRTPTNPLDAAVTANAQAISTTEYWLAWMEAYRRVRPFTTSARSPLVISHERTRTAIDPGMTTAAEALWRTIPLAPNAPRTLFILSNDMNYRWLRVEEPDLCVGRLTQVRNWRSTPHGFLAGAGGCFLTAKYGRPGAGLASWVDSVGGLEVPRRGIAMPTEFRTVLPQELQWAESRSVRESGGRIDWWVPTTVRACAGGQEEQCVAAMGFGPDGLKLFSGWEYGSVLHSRLLAVMYAEIGTDRFREIWRSDEPLPIAFQRVTGTPFAPWAMRFVQMHVGRVQKDNALSLPGWLGWALWMTLLMAWTAVRLRGKEAL